MNCKMPRRIVQQRVYAPLPLVVSSSATFSTPLFATAKTSYIREPLDEILRKGVRKGKLWLRDI